MTRPSPVWDRPPRLQRHGCENSSDELLIEPSPRATSLPCGRCSASPGRALSLAAATGGRRSARRGSAQRRVPDVWRQAAAFEARSSVSTWLLAIARYRRCGPPAPVDAELDDKVAATVADPADNPEIVLQKKNRAEHLRQSLASLSPEHGEVIDLVYYHDKSVKEVAEIVGVAEATVKTRCSMRAENCGREGRRGRRLARPPELFANREKKEARQRPALAAFHGGAASGSGAAKPRPRPRNQGRRPVQVGYRPTSLPIGMVGRKFLAPWGKVSFARIKRVAVAPEIAAASSDSPISEDPACVD